MLHVIEYFTDSLKVIQDHSKWHRLMDRVYTSCYWHFIVTMALIALSCIISDIKRDIDSKSVFFIPHVHSLGGSPSEYCDTVWLKKTIVGSISDGEKG